MACDFVPVVFKVLCEVQMAMSGRTFLINQFGLAMFQWDGQRYAARTYNFYMFPRPFQGYDRRFMCQVAPLQLWAVTLLLSCDNFLRLAACLLLWFV